jgi:hypothetical protein
MGNGNYFLIVYDRLAGRILETREYPLGERERALAERAELILSQRDSRDVEVVLFGAESLADLRKTHARYFQSAEEIVADSTAIKR